MTSTAVRVALRVRPLTTKEQLSNCTECLTFIPNEPQVLMGTDKSFTYDYVFDTKSTQASVYSTAIAPLLHKFIEGFNATVLAYGQTGAGKTFSMGTGLDNTKDKENQGIVPRCILELYQVLQERTDNEEGYSYEILVSFLELHNEDLIDLLNPPAVQKRRSGQSPMTEVTIREDMAGNIYWTGVKEERCYSPDELLGLLEKGSLCRTTGSTEMNSVSSRSHAMFTVTLKQQRLEQDESDSTKRVSKSLTSKFHFVDLAGSERLKRTNAEGDRAKEGIAINAGLLALGNVISALGDETRRGAHVPYRDSKLTRLLQDSLGGNSQTLMMACVSPSDSNFGETLNTLRYANRARNIKNRVTINQDFAGTSIEVNQLRALVARLRMEISALRSNGIAISTNEPAATVGVPMADGEARILKKEITRLRERLQSATDEMIKASTERDTLLMERAPISEHNDDDEVETNNDGEGRKAVTTTDHSSSVIISHPLVAKYLKTIQELNDDLIDAKDRLDFLENAQISLTPLPCKNTTRFPTESISTCSEQQIYPRRRQQQQQQQRRKRSGVSSKRRYGRPGRITSNNNSSTTTNATVRPDLRQRSEEYGKRHLRRSSDNDTRDDISDSRSEFMEDEDEGYVNDLQDENMRHEFKESIAKAREEIRKGMEFLELIKPGDDYDLEAWDKELKLMMQSHDHERTLSDEGTFSAAPSPTSEMDMTLSPWLADLEHQDKDSDVSSSRGSLCNRLSITSLEMDMKHHDPKLVRMIHQIQSDIKVKEELVSHLEKSENEYLFMRRKFDDKINRLQDQLAELQQDRDAALKRTKGLFGTSGGPSTAGSPVDANHQQQQQQQQTREKQQLLEIRQAYEMKMKHLLTEIQELKRKYSQTTSAMHVTRNQNESLLKSLRVNVETLKMEKKQMLKRMKQEADRVREQMTHQERRIQQLQRQHTEATAARRRLERERDLQKQTLKKRNEEVVMNSSQLKQLTCIMKKAVREGGILDERLLSKVSHIVGGNFAILARGSNGFPLRGGGHTRNSVNSNNNNGRRSNKNVSSIPLQVRASRKKKLLDKALCQYVQGKQAVVEMEQLLVRRERLSDEKQDLMDERRHIYLLEKERTDKTGTPMDTSSIEFMDERIDLISAEIAYLSSRIHGLQMEAAANDSSQQQQQLHQLHHRIEKHVTFADEIVTDPPPSDEWADMCAFEEKYTIPSNAAPDLAYEITTKLLKSLKADECKQIAEALLEDIMELRMAECNRQMTMQNLEKTVVDMRRTLIVMKRAAVASTVENERRIRRLENGLNGGLESVEAMDRKMEEYISSGNTIFDKIYEDGLRGMINNTTSSPIEFATENVANTHAGSSQPMTIDRSMSPSDLLPPGLLVSDDCYSSDALMTPSSYVQTPTTPADYTCNTNDLLTIVPQHDYHHDHELAQESSTSFVAERNYHHEQLAAATPRVETTPSPDRFYNMIHKRLSSPRLPFDDNDSVLPMVMPNPLEFRRISLEQPKSATLSSSHADVDLADDSSTSSIRSSHLRQPQLPPSLPSSSESVHSDKELPPLPPNATMSTTRQRSSLQQPVPPSSLFDKATHRNSLPPSLSTMRRNNIIASNSVFDRLASSSTRASRAKLHRLSY